MNRKSRFLAITLGAVAFIGTAVMGSMLSVGLGNSLFSIDQIYNILVESTFLALPVALLGYIWGLVFPPRSK